MIARALLLLVLNLAIATASAGQSAESSDHAKQDGREDDQAAVHRPMQDIKNVESAERVNDERFSVREEFGQTQARQRTRWMAPESIDERSRMKEAEVEQSEDDIDAVTSEPARANDEDGRTDKNDRARTLEPCGTNVAASHIAANASATSSGSAAGAAGGAIQQGCAN